MKEKDMTLSTGVETYMRDGVEESAVRQNLQEQTICKGKHNQIFLYIFRIDKFISAMILK